VEHGVEVVTVMAAGTGGGSGVRSDVLFDLLQKCGTASKNTIANKYDTPSLANHPRLRPPVSSPSYPHDGAFETDHGLQATKAGGSG